MEADFYFYRRGDKNMIDKKITKGNNSKNTLALLTVMVMLMATLLTACGSDKTTDTSAMEDTTNVEAAKEADSTETTETEEVAEVEPAVEEPTAEPTSEPVVYEGIDMESTLPGLEWMATFDNIVDEIVVVVYNDETNKKVIVEEGDEVEFSKSSDILAFYTPNAETIPIIGDSGGFDENWEGGNELADSLTSPRRIACEKGVSSEDDSRECSVLTICNGEEKTYEFTLKFVE